MERAGQFVGLRPPSRAASWVTHNALLHRNQMTLNTNMASNGYSGRTPLGKIG